VRRVTWCSSTIVCCTAVASTWLGKTTARVYGLRCRRTGTFTSALIAERSTT
jgi:hypothetical protein